VLDLGEGRIALVMADVSGKGLAAAARTARARFALQAYAFEDPRPLSVLRRLNRFLYEQSNPAGDFITLFYAVFNTVTGEVRCSSAGHEPPVLIRRGLEPQFLEFTGIPCGIYTHQECEEGYFSLHPGDRLLLYSDGVTEARRERVMFGFDGLRRALVQEGENPPDSLVRRIYRQALRFSNGIMRDDVALLLVEAESEGTESGQSPEGLFRPGAF